MSVGAIVLCTIYVLCSMVLVVYGVQCYVMSYLFLRRRSSTLARQREILKYFDGVTDESKYPTVVTQLPMYNEQTVAVRVIEAAAAMDYPHSRHEIQVLDDSSDETRAMVDATAARLRAQGVRVNVIRRPDRIGFKAGALQYGLGKSDARFVAIFDADFVPPVDFLRKAVTFFMERPKLGLVQGRWTHLNRNASLLTRGQALGIDGHFAVEQAARSWNSLFMNFNGTAGLFRREAIETSGGWQHDTLTEDMDLSYRMQLNGWEAEYVPDLVVPAEIPEDVNGFKNQQFRWAKGSIQTARKIIPQLWRRRVPAFTLFQAVLHLTHYAVHPFMLFLSLLTIPVLATLHNVHQLIILIPVVVGMVLSTSGPSAMYMVAQHALGNRSRRKYLMIPAMMFIGVGLAVNNTRAVLEAVLGMESPFHRTPKKGQRGLQGYRYRPIKDVTCLIELALGVYCMVGFSIFFLNSSFIITPFLAIYSAGYLFVGLLSIIHYRNPELIDYKLRLPWRPRIAV
jgi:cellulose synthase/poly-beta-1,6-N-acetylglucosamine synthase-like glycosyltransferase